MNGSVAHEVTATAFGAGHGRPVASASMSRAQRAAASGPASSSRPAALWKTKKTSTGPAPNASSPIAQTIHSPGSRGKTIRCGKPAARQNGSSNRSTTFS